MSVLQPWPYYCHDPDHCRSRESCRDDCCRRDAHPSTLRAIGSAALWFGSVVAMFAGTIGLGRLFR
jgi:hypothetical protein